MLILFDIDGTLLRTQGAGIKAMRDAGRELFGEHFTMDGVEFSGRLDPLIWNDLVQINGVPDGDANHERFRQAYGRLLAERLQRHPTAALLPGVSDLISELGGDDRITLGLLTGNYPETGQLKLRAAGLDPDVFTVVAWGCDGVSRRDLPPIAIKRHAERTGRTLPHHKVVIVGDTPRDVDCAKAHGCRSIGVATGVFSVDSLRHAGADLALENLAGAHVIISWLQTNVGGGC
jgi:phosphoglycolate phosphatase